LFASKGADEGLAICRGVEVARLAVVSDPLDPTRLPVGGAFEYDVPGLGLLTRLLPLALRSELPIGGPHGECDQLRLLAALGLVSDR